MADYPSYLKQWSSVSSVRRKLDLLNQFETVFAGPADSQTAIELSYFVVEGLLLQLVSPPSFQDPEFFSKDGQTLRDHLGELQGLEKEIRSATERLEAFATPVLKKQADQQDVRAMMLLGKLWTQSDWRGDIESPYESLFKAGMGYIEKSAQLGNREGMLAWANQLLENSPQGMDLVKAQAESLRLYEELAAQGNVSATDALVDLLHPDKRILDPSLKSEKKYRDYLALQKKLRPAQP